MRIAFSKPMTARFKVESSLHDIKLVADEGHESMRWGKRAPYPYGECLAQLVVLIKLLLNRSRVDAVVAGRYGDLISALSRINFNRSSSAAPSRYGMDDTAQRESQESN